MANRIISEKELKDSGASSLREFLNKERGLTMKAPEGTKAGVNKARPSTQDRMTMEAQDNANRGLDELGQPIQRTEGYSPRDQYMQSGKAMVDKQDAMAKRNASMKNYAPRRDPNASARAALSSGKGDEAGNSMKRGGAVKKMAKGGSASSRADGIAQRGKTRGKMC
ncbi:hypothetical protein UFOVP1049_11 [uncultured Caudovirales phage]|uniref:Uncharacterized protein n=1 Tax=uncultured Caudovirales phage TaxID=2100421 RepID=A0A6J5QCQ8_9CAUD|nr:hypothetical protein UFOVP1049_11 [uncultured Caudovirales phage]